MALTKKKLLLPLQCRLNTIFFPGCVKIIGYFASGVNVWFNPYVGPSTRIKISFPLLSTWTDEFISAPKIITLLSTLPSINGNSEWESNPMP